MNSGGRICVLALSLTACRDAAAPYAPPEPFRFHEQLTFGAGDDLEPTWAPDGDRLIYSTDNYQPLPCFTGVMLTIPAAGGTALPLLEDVQLASRRALVAPALSPDGTRLAYFDLLGPLPLCRAPEPVAEAFLRVRRMGSRTNMLEDPSIRVADSTSVAWAIDTTRITWAADNRRVAFADSIGIRVWSTDQRPPALIPNTSQARTPAWSPTGDRIAFVAVREGMPRIVITDLTGVEQTTIGIGEEPAWSPDGSYIYARQGDNIVRIRLTGGETETVAGTRDGRSPAVSPDGRRLAFVRDKAAAPNDADIWVIDLPFE